ncbi:MAG: four helix bundle protein [Candidatus Terrybacteria bacterium]|nr:four helix bundle protein [Candidatus Terrybacteria bacterium]
MASIQKFEDLICWQKARELANFIFNITDKPVFKDFDLKRQIRRAAISPMSNIAEGFDRGTRAEFIDALFIAKGEAGEVRSQLYIAYDRKYIDESKLKEGLKLTDECSRLIHSFAEKVKNSHGGLQFKKAQKTDPLKDLTKENSPELYQRFYGEK